MKLDLERLPSDKPREGSDSRLVVCEKFGCSRAFIERTGLRLLDPDVDQVSREVMAATESM
ncbi:hypothetical protein ACFQD0_00495 [Sulfitobacter aestuariivivens]|uniref:hypothetical protein n=1 Tax=Sulfitobacter aestuariivivens TaxID=2766981 RepID=UPI001C20C8A3|nr:hypothetical protein [Sulfitobacter aestuariivivens]